MDALDILRMQHAEIQEHFDHLTGCEVDGRRRTLEILVDAIEMNLRVEDRHVYAVVEALESDAERSQAAEEHRGIRRAYADLIVLDPLDPRFLRILRVLYDQWSAHRNREEGSLFRRIDELTDASVRAALGRSMLETIAEIENENWVGAMPTAR
jgi:hypothetical protein